MTSRSLAALVYQATPSSQIHIIKNDEIPFTELKHFLPYFSAVFVGPGPGSPVNPSDVGVVKELWHIPEDLFLPIFGVCLGLQSLGVEYGATLKRLSVVKHGYVSRIFHDGDGLFSGIPNDCAVVRYHSLHVDDVEATRKLKAIAWTDDGSENGKVVMGIKHIIKPFYAVQYHPESICTDGSGLTLLENFWRLANQWSFAKNRSPRRWDVAAEHRFSNSWPMLRPPKEINTNYTPQKVTTCTLSLPQLSITQICEVLGVYKTSTDFVLLDSAAQPGRFSIIGCIHSSTLKLMHSVGDKFITMAHGNRQSKCSLGSSDIWTWLACFVRRKEAAGGDKSSPFWGGLIGYLSYELGKNSLGVRSSVQGKKLRHPDVNLVFVERSLVVDTSSGKIFLQSLIPKDDDWFARTASILKRAACGVENAGKLPNPRTIDSLTNVKVKLPDKRLYIEQIKEAQQYLFSGESYELCLTARTSIRVPKTSATTSQTSWDLYKRVRSVNPAPYSAYLRLQSSLLLSSSPERFLSFSRPPQQRLQLRPIKGTVRKGNDMTQEMAENILRSQKEIGENLMIVDLIRHDLHGVLGANVRVKKFCGIEEYQTVWQLVSVIEGEVDNDTCDMQIGWETLSKSLPPGTTLFFLLAIRLICFKVA